MHFDSSLFVLPENVETRWASPENPEGRKGEAARANKSRKGRPNFALEPGQSVVLAQGAGSGIVRRIWITIDDRSPEALRGLRLDMYWDGAATPAVSAPFADFFGQGLGCCQTFESIFFSNPEGRSFNCVIPMPFRNGFRIVLTSEITKRIDLVFYDIDYTLGDRIEHSSYFHAHWRREAPTTLMRDFEVLPKVSGRGRYLGANFGLIADTKKYLHSWCGEGESKIYLDGDTDLPTLAGTGMEDYIGSAWGQGQYAHLYQGCHLADNERKRFAFYRYHVPDPVYFQRDIRVTFQQIGGASAADIRRIHDLGVQLIGSSWLPAGESMNMSPPEGVFSIFEREDDWSSCCYFYLDRPENGLPPLAPVAERTRGLGESTSTKTVGLA